MATAELALDSRVMATPKPLPEVASEFQVSARTMWAWATQFGLTKYQMPGKGKTVYLDSDEVRRKVRAMPRRPKPPPA